LLDSHEIREEQREGTGEIAVGGKTQRDRDRGRQTEMRDSLTSESHLMMVEEPTEVKSKE
jgi:hypothetical protein